MATSPDMPYKYNVATDFSYLDTWYPVKDHEMWRTYQSPLTNFDWKDDDILIATYPRSGTHMIWHVARWILQKSGKTLPDPQEESFINIWGYRDNQKDGRRVFSGHFTPFVITEDVILKGNRQFIYVIRNPKDVAISFHTILPDQNKVFPIQFSWEDYQQKHIDNNHPCPVTGRSWFNHVKAFEEFMNKHPEAPILVLYYEEAIKNIPATVRKVAKFLRVDLTDEIVEDIADKAHFSKMKHAPVSEIQKNTGHDTETPNYYRKGIIGDWKRVFTVAQNEEWNRKSSELMKGWKIFDRIIYEDPDSKLEQHN